MKITDYAKTIEDICNEYATCWGHDVTYGQNDPYEAYKYLINVFEKQTPEMLEKISASKDPMELFERYYKILFAYRDKVYANEKSAVARFVSILVSDSIKNYEGNLTTSLIFETLLTQRWTTSSGNQGRWNNRLIQRYIDLATAPYELWKLRLYLYGGNSFNKYMLNKIAVKLMDLSTDKEQTMRMLEGCLGIFGNQNYHDVIYSPIERRINEELKTK